MLTEQQKVDVRRHAGYSLYGSTSASPPSISYRYNPHYLNLEYMMNNMAPAEEETLITVYVSKCNSLECAITKSSDNLDTSSAAVWVHNKNEVEDRWKLYKLWCNRLIEFMGLSSPSKMLSNISVVV